MNIVSEIFMVSSKHVRGKATKVTQCHGDGDGLAMC